MLSKHYPEMKSSKKKHLRMRTFHNNKKVDQKIKTEVNFILFRLQQKTDVKTTFFKAMQNFISSIELIEFKNIFAPKSYKKYDIHSIVHYTKNEVSR